MYFNQKYGWLIHKVRGGGGGGGGHLPQMPHPGSAIEISTITHSMGSYQRVTDTDFTFIDKSAIAVL